MSTQAATYLKYVLNELMCFEILFQFLLILHFQDPPYSRLPPPAQPHPSLDELHRRRKEIMAQLEERKVISPPPFAPSPTLPPTFHQEEVSKHIIFSSIYQFFLQLFVVCLK